MSAPGIALDYDRARDKRARDELCQLTPKELAIAQALAGGRPMPEIAAMVELTMEGLPEAIEQIFAKLGVESLADLLQLFFEMPTLHEAADVVYLEDLGIAYASDVGRWVG